MAPVEGQTAMMTTGAPGPGGPTIPLSTLIDYILQRSYHELTVLSELLPRMTDMERKIKIVQFASQTRQLFVRLLALVKWANSASKVDKCAMISSILDQQTMLFVDTADQMARMARETLIQARLPCFSLPCAIDVLTTGTYPRLPACIKEKIVPPDPITHEEKKQTLVRLNQIIEHRLVTGDLPSRMQRPVITNGRVKFQVEHEFAVTLTVMGDGANIPWRMLDIEILVEDPETGDGKALVHSLQVSYIHQLVQSRLMENDRPLYDLYNCIHSFCQSLQLEVLHSQAQQLIYHRLGESVRIEEYMPGKSLVVSYWREPMRKDGRPFSTVYKLSIHVDNHDVDKPLQVSHFPQILGSESTHVSQAIRSDHLSIEKLLMHTIQVRSLSKLKELEREFRLMSPGPCEIRDLPTLLKVPVIYPCMETEYLCVAVDVMKGSFCVSLAQKENQFSSEIEACVNADKKDLGRHLSKLRLWLALERCKKSIQHVQMACLDHLPFANLSGHPLESISKHHLYIRLSKQSNTYIIVEAVQVRRTAQTKRTVEYNYYLLHASPAGIENDVIPASADTCDQAPPQAFLTAGHMLRLDTYSCTHGQGAQLFDYYEEDLNPLARKRKLLTGDMYEPVTKKSKGSPYFVAELTHILALCEDRVPLVILGEELQKQEIAHQGVQVDGDAVGLSLSVIDVLPCPGMEYATRKALQNGLLSLKVRIQRKMGRCWVVEALFTNCPVVSASPKERGPIHTVHFFFDMGSTDSTEKMVQGLLSEWKEVCHLYQAVSAFSKVYSHSADLQKELLINSYTYKKLVLGYGPNKSYRATIQYQGSSDQFHISFGTYGSASIANCHSIVATQLQQDFNNHRSIATLAQILVDTSSPLSSIGKLPLAPIMGISGVSKGGQPVPSFNILPQSTSHIRLVFRTMYCIDLHCRSNQTVAVRDGAFGMFDTSKAVEGLNPIPGLKAFLNLYVDETVMANQTRRRSNTEDDNPPSPVGMDPVDNLVSSQQSSTGSPATGARIVTKQETIRFHSPMTPPSNPNTPASPRMSQPGPGSSPAGVNFPLASPPSLQHVVAPSPSNVMAPSPSNPALHVPSPSSFVPAPSPGSLGIHMPSPASQYLGAQGMVEPGGSPYPRNWPCSPSVPGPSPASRYGTAPSPGHSALLSPQQGKDVSDLHSKALSVMSPPSRMLPQRPWAASVATLLSHEALDRLLTPGPPPGALANDAPFIPCCPLERFLCLVFLRRHVQRIMNSEKEVLQTLPCNEPGVILFQADSLQFRVSLNPQTLQTLHMKVSVVPERSNEWEVEELQILEKFFESRVVCPPYKSSTLTAFGKLLGATQRVLKDCIQIMRLEIMPEANMKWGLTWCLTIPQGGSPHPLAPVGTPAVLVRQEKFLFMLQLNRIGPATSSNEPASNIVPILYNMTTNTTQMVEQRPAIPSQASFAINNSFKRFSEFNPKPNDCSIYPAIRELLSTLTIPGPM